MNRMIVIATAFATFCCITGVALAADYPQAEISNGQIRAKLYLPDTQTGFYRATRFDWSGLIYSLESGGHNYYGPWFTKSDPTVRDFSYVGEDIVVGAASGSMGPAEEFQRPLGYEAAKAGETFVKIGVGVLRKPDDTAYNAYKAYEIVDAGKWSIQEGAASVTFTQTLSDPASGYGYVYVKTVRLTNGRPEMAIEHSLKCTGRLPITTTVYDHNFLVLDGKGPGPGYEITVPFQIKTARPPAPEMATVQGQRVSYVKQLVNQERVSASIEGFSSDPKDYDIRIENRKTGAGMRIMGDRPLARMALWSIRSVMAMEPFLDVAVEPGQEFAWKYTYSYYTVPKAD